MDLVSLQVLLGNLSFAVLFGALIVYWVNLSFSNFGYLNTLGTILVAIANLAIAALLGARWIEAGYFPISNLYESLFFLGWGITLVHLFAEKMTRSRFVGVFTSPILLGISAFATLTLPPDMQMAEPLVPALKSNWLMMHVSVMMLSYAALLVGSLVAIAFLFITWGQQIEIRGSSVGSGAYRLGQRNLDDVLTLESLTLADTLDNISYRIIGLGFPLLTIGIIAGAVWANEAWGSYWSWDPKETWALITWLVYAAYLHSRISRGWQGRKPALLASAGFLVVWVCYLGVNLLGKGLHSYGWFL